MTSGSDTATVTMMDAVIDTARPIAAAPLTALSQVRHGFFTRLGGVSRGVHASLNTGLGSRDDRECVLENRARAASALGAQPTQLATPFQVHSADAVHVADPWPAEKGPKADALVTSRPGVAIGIGTADCGPVLFADAEVPVVGAAHAGWKGASSGVLEASVKAMEALGARRERIIAVLGPTISQAAYEVGPEFVERFVALDPANRRYFAAASRPDHAMFDLPGYIVARLRSAGVATALDIGRCTYRDEEQFFSYRRATHRRERDYGRLLAAIMVAPE